MQACVVDSPARRDHEVKAQRVYLGFATTSAVDGRRAWPYLRALPSSPIVASIRVNLC